MGSATTAPVCNACAADRTNEGKVAQMKVCAHINYGPFNNGHKRFDSSEEAVAYFTAEVAGVDFGTGLGDVEEGTAQTIDLYPQCDDCKDGENYHDYPMSRYHADSAGDVTESSI